MSPPEKLRLIVEAPALVKTTWLPTDSGIDWLDSLGEDHRRLLARRAEIGAARSTLARGFEAEDDARRDAAALAIRTGRQPDLPSATPPDEREAALAGADEQVNAANDALDGFLADAIAAIEEHAPEWLAALSTRRDDAASKRREAARLLAEAEAEETRVFRLEQWVKRNGGVHERRAFRTVPAMRYVGWDHVETAVAPPPIEDDGMGGVRPQVVDNHNPETFLRDINRGILPPHQPPAADRERLQQMQKDGTAPLSYDPDSATPLTS